MANPFFLRMFFDITARSPKKQHTSHPIQRPEKTEKNNNLLLGTYREKVAGMMC